MIGVPQSPALGYHVRQTYIERLTVEQQNLSAPQIPYSPARALPHPLPRACVALLAARLIPDRKRNKPILGRTGRRLQRTRHRKKRTHRAKGWPADLPIRGRPRSRRIPPGAAGSWRRFRNRRSKFSPATQFLPGQVGQSHRPKVQRAYLSSRFVEFSRTRILRRQQVRFAHLSRPFSRSSPTASATRVTRQDRRFCRPGRKTNLHPPGTIQTFISPRLRRHRTSPKRSQLYSGGRSNLLHLR